MSSSTTDITLSSIINASHTTLGNETVEPNRTSSGIVDLEWNIAGPLYCLIFILSALGNGLVILTLIQNKRMRTVTNVFLLNLAISDLLLAVFCMPFTLIPMALQNFIFGEFMCVSIRYFQGVSVAVSCFTLVVISVERYYAICRPLKSRSWQTKSHAYKAIAGIWCVSLIIMIPIAVFTKLINIKGARFACRENWKDEHWDKVYAVFQDIVLLLMPLIIMAVAYALVSRELWMSYASLVHQEREDEGTDLPTDAKSDDKLLMSANGSDRAINKTSKYNGVNIGKTHGLSGTTSRITNQRSHTNKRRVIKMLFVIVLEYFVCWTPLYVISTWMIVDYDDAKAFVSPLAKSLFHLLAYVSSCIHPMTYCFMNNRFRQGFLSVFRCCGRSGSRRSIAVECTDVSESHTRMRGIVHDKRR